jgi:hypothetical protein
MVVGSALLVIAAFGALGAYLYAGTRQWAAAESAHRRLDCGVAADRYERAGWWFVAARPLYGDDPDARGTECRMIEAAERHREYADHPGAADGFRDVIEAYPRSIVRDTLEHREARAHLATGASIASHGRTQGSEQFVATPTGGVSRFGEALAAYDAVLWRYPRFAEATTARGRLGVLWRAAQRGSDCATAEQMMALRKVGDITSAEAAELRRRARQREPRARFACARQQFRSGRIGNTITTLRELIDDYPRSSISRAASPLLIDAEVARVRSGRRDALPPPAAVGSGAGDLVDLTIRNASPTELEVLLSGPSSRRARVRACDGCREYAANERPDDPCATRYPATVVSVPPGTYEAVVRTPGGGVTPFYGTWELSGSFRYTHCVWTSN